MSVRAMVAATTLDHAIERGGAHGALQGRDVRLVARIRREAVHAGRLPLHAGQGGSPNDEGEGVLAGHATAARADRPAARITTCEVEDVLAAIRATYADRGRQTPGRREPTTPGVLPRGYRASALR